MDYITELINGFQTYIFISMFAIIIILLIMTIAALKSISKLQKKFKRFTRGTDSKSMEQMISSYLDRIDENKNGIKEIDNKCDEISERLNKCIQKKSIIRYKAFDDIGSDLSFSIALLDNSNSGVVLTGIYGRSESVVYAKPVDRGVSRYELSDEEKQALNEACNN